MNKQVILKVLVILMVTSLVLSACGDNATKSAENQQPTAVGGSSSGSADATAVPAEQITASSGFVCPVPNPKLDVTSKEINLFVWTEYIPTDMIECFEKVYGIKVNRDEYSSNEEMYAKISAGGTNYDLVQPTDYIIALMIRQNLLQKLDHAKLPVLKNMDPNYLNLEFDPGNAYTLPYQAGTDAIVYNADKVPNPPKSWEDMWKPEYAGRMVFLDDSRVIIGLTLLTLGFDPNTTDPAQLDQAKVKLTKLISGIKLFDSDSPKTALIAGDVDLGMTWTAEAFLAQKEKPSISYVYPTEGAMLWQDNWAIPTGVSHEDAVYAWLNYTLQGDVFWLMLRDFPYINPDKAALDYAKDSQAEIYNTYMGSNITNPPAEAIAKGHRIKDVGDALPLYDQIWTEVKGGSQ
ncbi:MAG: spermidine/putrescine ABC transporter substrate-binding protein [Chloroflexota bacterium]